MRVIAALAESLTFMDPERFHVRNKNNFLAIYALMPDDEQMNCLCEQPGRSTKTMI